MNTEERGTTQQVLIRAAFEVYRRKCEELRYPMCLEAPTFIGDDLLFHGGRLGAHVGFSVWELAEFMQYLEKTHKLFQPCVTRFFIDLNGKHWEAFQGDTQDSCVQRVTDVYEAENLAYRASDRFVEDLAKAAATEAANYVTCNHAAYSLAMNFDHMDVANWIVKFVEVSNKRGALIEADATHVFRRLQILGYTVNEGVGTEPKTFEEHVRYIAGQVMNYCQKGHPPHEILGDWAKNAIKAESAIKDQMETTDGQSTSDQ